MHAGARTEACARLCSMFCFEVHQQSENEAAEVLPSFLDRWYLLRMRFAAMWLLAATLLTSGCAARCDVNRCPLDLTDPRITVAFYDGSANGYIFNAGMVEYRPVTPETSSTGKYSGGTPFKRSLDAPSFAKIAHALNAAIDAKATHTPDRAMLTGAITVSCGKQSRNWIILNGTAELEAIETLMLQLKKAGKGP